MTILAGTSGYSYPAWKGRFYPRDLPASRMLRFYAERFATVEINATFYRMPSPRALAAWRTEVPDGFTFALKAPQRITHVKRLLDAADPVRRFQEVSAELGRALGPVLFQLHPGTKADLPRLRDFLALLPRGGRAAFEFRHPSWLTDETFRALADAGAALCIADTEEGTTPRVATAPFGYLRLRRPEYATGALAEWRGWIAGQPWHDAFVFFKHEDEARGPELAARFGRLGGAERPAPAPG